MLNLIIYDSRYKKVKIFLMKIKILCYKIIISLFFLFYTENNKIHLLVILFSFFILNLIYISINDSENCISQSIFKI